jgi:phosphoenolpyruvate synthase/pyruvate phosphate dikinase
MLSWSELRHHLANGQPITADLEQRRLEIRDRQERPAAPDTIVNRTRLTGVAAAPGVASRKALVVHDPSADHPDGDILVAHATDTAWTRLFLGRAAIVTGCA